ncbi:hypothetical protein BDZ45DRAFT_743609 [Acephala macrosclerotiorum]|nr:hypothetical protein BDZ45DRAFT_743609 [Acephala macrosclerotiorum]
MPPNSCIEPSFEPQLTQYDFDLIFNYLVRYRDELVFETLHFEISEQQLYWYILRSGFTGLETWQWRGFLQECNRTGKLFSWKEHFEPPTPTQGMVRRNPNGWPTAPPKNQSGTTTYTWFTHGRRLARLYDFDKEVCLFLVRKIMKRSLGWTQQEISEVEFDTKGPKGIVKKSDDGWPPLPPSPPPSAVSSP